MFTVSRNERRKEFLFRAKNATGAQKFYYVYLTPLLKKFFFASHRIYRVVKCQVLGQSDRRWAVAYCSVVESVPIIVPNIWAKY